MSIIMITGSLFAAKCGEANTNRYTIITTERVPTKTKLAAR